MAHTNGPALWEYEVQLCDAQRKGMGTILNIAIRNPDSSENLYTVIDSMSSYNFYMGMVRRNRE